MISRKHRRSSTATTMAWRRSRNALWSFLPSRALRPTSRDRCCVWSALRVSARPRLPSPVAEAMGRNYTRMSLGGVRDEADIRGHRKTYIGAMPGRIMDALRRAGTSNPLILLDEIDKMGNDFRGDPASAMLEVLDTEQNVAFRDHYIELPFDLSDVVFLTTANDLSTVPRPLLDRMEVIELPSYTAEEKRLIARRHLLSKQMKKHGLSENQLIVDDETLDAIICGYTREAGVRRLEQVLAKLCRKAAKHIADGDESLTATKENLEELLGTATFKDDVVEREGRGRHLSTVSAWTSVGGEMLEVEVAVVPGTGKIEITGNLGTVMQESAKAAVTFVRSKAEALNIDPMFYKNNDLHIHFPEAAIPKDGPSAGVTITTALISALTGAPVRHEVAMTARGNAARPRAADRRSARENHGGVPRGHQDRVHSEGQRERFEGYRAGRSGKHQLCHCGAHGHGGGDRDRLFAPSQAEKTQVRTGKTCSGLGIDNGGTIIWK